MAVGGGSLTLTGPGNYMANLRPHHTVMGRENKGLEFYFYWGQSLGPGGFYFGGLRRVGHDWATDLNWTETSSIGEGNGTPLQYSFLENPMDGGAWSAAVHGVAKSWTWLSDFTFMHWRRKWQPTPVFLPGESQGRRSMVGCRLWGGTGSDTTEAT